MAETKRLYVQNVDAWQRELSKKRFSDRKLEVKVIEQGIVLPARPANGAYEGGVCDKDFNFVAGVYRIEQPAPKWFNPWGCVKSSYVVDRKELTQLDEDVIYGGALMGHFGHFIMESWNRLWYVVQNPDLKSKILFITTSHGGYHSYFDEFFQLMGIDKERIVYVNKPMQCRFVTVPDQSQYSLFSFTKEFLLPYQAIRSRVTSSNHKKLYLTRTEFEDTKDDGKGSVRCFNEKYFEDFFVERGFEAISMEKLSIEEQISIIMGADEIASTLGTLSHWMIFCKPSTKFIMLNRQKDATIPHQCLLNEAFNFNNYYIVDASKSFMYANRSVGVCMLGSNEYWKEFVADYFGEQIDECEGNPYVEATIDNYVDYWCEKYPVPNQRHLWVSSLKDFCHRIVMLETQENQNRPLLTYQTHVGKNGWGAWKNENFLSNPVDQQLDIQAIKIDFSESFQETRHTLYYNDDKGWTKDKTNPQMSIETIKRDFTEPFSLHYAVYYNEKEGWSEEVTNGQMAGTTGKSKAITGIKIRLDKAGAKEFDILYRVHKFDGEWTAWAKNGEEIITGGV